MQSDHSRRLKYIIGISLYLLSIVLFLYWGQYEIGFWLLVLSTVGFTDFLFQDLFPQWWHWGRWAGQISDEISDEVMEFTGFFVMAVSCMVLGLIYFF